MHIDLTTQENFWQRVVVGENEQDCWGWTGSTSKGQARISIGGEWYLASRIAWILTNGPVPGGGRIRRRCGSLLCANPLHSELIHDSTEAERFWARVDIVDDEDSCWEWQAATNRSGYGKVYTREAGEPIPAHRVAYGLENGPIPDGMFVLHVCDNPSCCRPSHLELGTLQDNYADMVQKGRHQHGESHHSARLTAEQVMDIRRRANGGENQRRLAEEYGVSPATICNIKKQTTWRE